MIRSPFVSFRFVPYSLAALLAAASGAVAWGCLLQKGGGGGFGHLLVVSGVVLGFLGALGVLVGGLHTSRRIAQIHETLRKVSEGELGARAPTASMIVELEAIARAVNGLGESNSALVSELRDGSTALQREIGAFQQAFDRIRAQAARSREATSTVAAAMEELGAGVGTIGRETAAVHEVAKDTCGLARRLDGMAASTAQAIERLFRAMREAESRMEEVRASSADLEQRTDEISGAASSITGVAKNLRLLALNASIEAVKAGESGRGFSIVAQEVKELADQVGDMADRIQAQVAAVYQGTRKVAADMTVSVEAVEAMKAEGARSVEVAAAQSDLSRESVAKLEETSRSIEEISRTLAESRVALDEIGRTSVELDARAGATAAALGSLDESVSDLDRLSRSFHTTVKDFRLGDPFFRWSDSLSVGVPRMDDQHRVLLRLINRVADLGASGASGSAIRTILGQLVEYTRFHFADEEKLMETHGFPGLAGHHEIHERFVAEAVEMVRRLGDGESFDAGELLRVLRDWLVRHIQGTDKVYGEHVRRRVESAVR